MIPTPTSPGASISRDTFALQEINQVIVTVMIVYNHTCNSLCNKYNLNFIGIHQFANPKLGLIISFSGNLVDFDLTQHHQQMGWNKHQNRRNLNGLHEEVVALPPREFTQLPPPTTPLHDMKVLVNVGNRTFASLLNNTFQRIGFL